MERNESRRAYMFYASDYHFEMIGLLNINKEIKENKKIVILTENNLQESIETVLSKVNLKEDEKNKIKQINWTDKGKEAELKNAVLNIKENQKLSIYIKGTEKFIKEQNQKIENLIKTNNCEVAYKNISITDCYNFIEISDNSKEIANKYSNKINTEGKKKMV